MVIRAVRLARARRCNEPAKIIMDEVSLETTYFDDSIAAMDQLINDFGFVRGQKCSRKEPMLYQQKKGYIYYSCSCRKV